MHWAILIIVQGFKPLVPLVDGTECNYFVRRSYLVLILLVLEAESERLVKENTGESSHWVEKLANIGVCTQLLPYCWLPGQDIYVSY